MFKFQRVALCVVLATLSSAAWANIDSFFDITYDQITDPAAESIEISVGHESTAGPMITDAELQVKLEGWGPPELPIEIFAHGGGSSSEGNPDWWVESFFDVFYEPPDPEPEVPPDSFFDVSFDFDLPGGVGSPLLTKLPDVYHIDSFFDITFQIELPDGGLHDLVLHGEVNDPGLRLVSVLTENVFAIDSFFDVVVQVEVPDPPLVAPDPCLVIKMTGLYTPEPATMGLLLAGALLALSRRKR